MNKDRKQEIRDAVNAITPGQWEWEYASENSMDSLYTTNDDDKYDYIVTVQYSDHSMYARTNDADFIASSPDFVRELLDALDNAEEARRVMGDRLGECIEESTKLEPADYLKNLEAARDEATNSRIRALELEELLSKFESHLEESSSRLELQLVGTELALKTVQGMYSSAETENKRLREALSSTNKTLESAAHDLIGEGYYYATAYLDQVNENRKLLSKSEET